MSNFKNGLYRHNKSNKLVVVSAYAFHAVTKDNPVVVFRIPSEFRASYMNLIEFKQKFTYVDDYGSGFTH